MKNLLTILMLILITCSCSEKEQRTVVTIQANQFLINDVPTHTGVIWEGNSIEGLLFNARLVQGIFDDLNPETRSRFVYPDSKQWDANRNTQEFVNAIQSWYDHGLRAFTLNLQGGSPMGYGNKDWLNSTFMPDGSLRQAYMNRLKLILDEADRVGMVVILGYFYFGQDHNLNDEQAIISAVDNITNWILEHDYQNILVELNNECDILYEHEILTDKRVVELMKRVKDLSKGSLLISTSFSGGHLPTEEILAESDYVLLHGNGVETPQGITDMIDRTKAMSSYSGQPIVFNEDDHYDFDKADYNLKRAVEAGTSWGYFDFRRDGETFENGFQSVPVDWTISSDRKKAFFGKIKEMTLSN